MNDEPKWQGSGYSPAIAWRRIQREDAAREFERRFPLGRWDNLLIPTGLVALLTLLVASVGGLAFWLLRALF